MRHDDLAHGLATVPLADLERADGRHAASELLERLRWPEGPVCAECDSRDVYRVGVGQASDARRVWVCRGCNAQATWRLGTFLEGESFPAEIVCRAALLRRGGLGPVRLAAELRALRVSASRSLRLAAAVVEAVPLELPQEAPERPSRVRTLALAALAVATALTLCLVTGVASWTASRDWSRERASAWVHGGETIRWVSTRSKGEQFAHFIRRHAADVEALQAIYPPDGAGRASR